MSRIGKKPILIPPGVQVKVDGQTVIVQGPKGELSRKIRDEVKAVVQEGKLAVLPVVQTKKTNAFWGMTRALLANMVRGVTEGFEKKLEIEGLGYKALPEGNDLNLHVGYTHPIKIKSPAGIKISVAKNTITVSGADKEMVGYIAMKIKKTKPAEPYKGKGIKYAGEIIRRKAGKKAATTGG